MVKTAGKLKKNALLEAGISTNGQNIYTMKSPKKKPKHIVKSVLIISAISKESSSFAMKKSTKGKC